MECYRAVVSGSDEPIAQEKISNLNAYDDMLFITTKGNGISGSVVSCLCPEGETVVLGRLSEDDINLIRREYGDNISMYIEDFGTYKRHDGSYRLWVELNISPDSYKGKSSLPLLIGVSAFTGVLTLVVILIRFVIKLRKKDM